MKLTLSKWTNAGLLFAGLILVNVAATQIPLQLDLTAERQHTLSDGSHALLGKLEEPVTLKFYYSRSIGGLPIFFKKYAGRIEDLLGQYAAAGGGNIRLQVIDPRPDTPEEEAAVREGLAGQEVGNGEKLFLGLVAIQANQEKVIPLFMPQREQFLEFDISQLIHQAQQTRRPKLGLLTPLPMQGQMDMRAMQMGQRPQDWVVMEELQKNYEVVPVSGDSLPEGLDVLFIAHPQGPSERLQYAIDQFLLSGKPVFLCVDPSSDVTRRSQGRQAMMMGGAQGVSSDLPKLLPAWGIEYAADKVVGDLERATQINTGRGASVSYPIWLSFDAFSKDSPMTAPLNSLVLIESGSFRLKEGTRLTLTPLIKSSGQSSPLLAATLGFTPPEELAKQILPDNQERVLAGVIRGKFKSAFPGGRPAAPAPAEGAPPPQEEPAAPALAESNGESTLVLVADSDFLADDYSVRKLNFLGTSAVQPLNDNLAFAVNTVDFLAGSQDLIGLRGKGTAQRPFKRIQEMEQAAQQEYQTQLDGLESRLREVQQKLGELQQRSGGEGQLIASPEVQQAIEDFRVQEAQMRSERREIRKKLRESIERLETGLAMLNLLALPVIVGALGVNYFYRRHRKAHT